MMSRLNDHFRKTLEKYTTRPVAAARLQRVARAGLGLLLSSAAVGLIISYVPQTVGLGRELVSSKEAGDSCVLDGGGGAESLDGWLTYDGSGLPIVNGAMVPKGTVVRIDALATASGRCDLKCDGSTAFTYERNINKIQIGVIASTIDGPNGDATVANVFGKDPATGQNRDYQTLDTRSSNSTGSVTYTLSSAGVYMFYFNSNINTLPCNLLPDHATPKYITVKVRDDEDTLKGAEPLDDTDSRESSGLLARARKRAGEPVEVANGSLDRGAPSIGGARRRSVRNDEALFRIGDRVDLAEAPGERHGSPPDHQPLDIFEGQRV
ncbi:MAG TPA: hypothetical protein VJ302_14340 [Blastocatellia bacterium]|nr:hypothetical protein [Blastocatellia bacterium]